MTRDEMIRASVARDMAEGLLTVDFHGRISSLNPAAEKILEKSAAELVGMPFGVPFFGDARNDAFNQLIMDAVYDKTQSHSGIVDYYSDTKKSVLRVTTSFLMDGEDAIGIIAVLNDISELTELRDAVVAMERIRELNGRLEMRNKLLSETFGRFLSDEIVRQLLETPDGLNLGGKKRPVSIMMSDLRGFTAMSERMPPSDLVTMLNHYLGEMTEVIQAHNGTIIEFIGDGIMAIYGAPVYTENHPSDAVAAGIEMQARMVEVNAWNARHGYPDLHMGIGINTGEVIVGNIGSLKRTKYGVMGSHVNLAGRIESYTVSGQVLIAPTTREAISAELTVAQEIEIYPKGVDKAITISQVTAIGAPYNVSCEIEEKPIPKLDREKPVSFTLLEGKHGSDAIFNGVITHLSDFGAILQTSTQLKVFDNIILQVGAKLFAKVMKAQGGAYTLNFTSVPPEFQQWKA